MLMSKSRHLRWNLRLLYMWGILLAVSGVLIILLPGMSFDNLITAILALVVLAMLNSWIRPALIMMSLPPTAALFGIITLTINAALIWLGDELIAGNIYELLPEISAVSEEREWQYTFVNMPHILMPEINVVAKN